MSLSSTGAVYKIPNSFFSTLIRFFSMDLPPYMSVMIKKNLDEKMRQSRPITNGFRMKLITRSASVRLCINISRDGNQNGKNFFIEDGNLELCNSIRKLQTIGQPAFGKVPRVLPVPATSTTTTTASIFVDAAITDWLHSYFARKLGNTFGALQSYCGKIFLGTCCDDRRCPE
ncbi:hypothetical protein MKW98_009080 [Papaver atlanticum]|uniref:Uncharacterized protein n=1 Tax=Papaver atlanticum TaxID=357466 RepID=A0AAD4T7W1_9MAGN|nr:hypothetical protein MKW98_009080 [Papaver atlanticum]